MTVYSVLINIYIYIKTDNMHSRLFPIHQWSHANSCTWAQDERLTVHHASKRKSYHATISGLLITAKPHSF